MSPLRASYSDGRSAVVHEVQLQPVHGFVWVQGAGWDRRAPLGTVEIGERLGRAPRLIRFDDGAVCEVPDGPAFEQWLEGTGYVDRAVDRAQRSWFVALIAVIAVVASGAAAYRWGLPRAAEGLAQRTPEMVTDTLSQQTLDLLDDHLLKPSTLSPDRQRALSAAFSRVDPQHRGQLLFRSGKDLGPNALALPDGRIVLLDELVALARHDDEIVAVLAHELGHVDRRHGLRLMIQGAAIGAFIAWWLGDFSPLVASAPAALLQASHSRELESEADADAARALRSIGIAPSRLADILERMAGEHGERTKGEPQAHEEWLDYLSSHPATRRRIQALRGERQEKEPS
ncbi:MAG: M48 family metallopeptidase [Panacagrimonas sp.]